ncbi:hypothetical protein FACS189431_2430 [Alphaproteobacteria bacterium]|nr:hypothetical protein FACS189431_2430 [Alphaproteobacteria bacterium]
MVIMKKAVAKKTTLAVLVAALLMCLVPSQVFAQDARDIWQAYDSSNTGPFGAEVVNITKEVQGCTKNGEKTHISNEGVDTWTAWYCIEYQRPPADDKPYVILGYRCSDIAVNNVECGMGDTGKNGGAGKIYVSNITDRFDPGSDLDDPGGWVKNYCTSAGSTGPNSQTQDFTTIFTTGAVYNCSNIVLLEWGNNWDPQISIIDPNKTYCSSVTTVTTVAGADAPIQDDWVTCFATEAEANDTMTSQTGGLAGNNSGAQTCESSSPLAWLLCPIANGLTGVIDTLTDFVSGGLRWSLLDNMQDTWSRFLPIANIIFAIVFLILIYSTATGIGLTNYSIKKIMPRLVIVAIAVNVSFYLCAAVADLSNIVGDGARDLILSTGERNDLDVLNGIVGNIVSTVAFLFIIVFAWSALALGLITIVLAVAARQAILALLVIISPVAIALALLPNTQQWFKKWFDAYLSLIIVYPMFMAAWAAARWAQYNLDVVAGPLNASNIITYIASSLLPIAPLFMILPLMKMSGGLMGKMTGAIEKGVNNNPVANALKEVNKRKNERVMENATKWGARQHAERSETNADAARERHRQELETNDARATGLRAELLAATTPERRDEIREQLDANADARTKLEDNWGAQLNSAQALDRENTAANAEARAHNNSRGRFRSAVGFGAQLASGELAEKDKKRTDEMVQAGRGRRLAEENTAAMNNGDVSVDRLGNVTNNAPIGSRLNPFSQTGRDARRAALVQAGAAQGVAKEAAEAELKGAVDATKLEGEANFGAQMRLNAAQRAGEATTATIKADATVQQLGDLNTINRLRVAENRTGTATARIEATKGLTNEAEIIGNVGTAATKVRAEHLKSNVDLEVKNATTRQTLEGGANADMQAITNAETDRGTILDNTQKTQATTQQSTSGRDIQIEGSAMDLKNAEDIRTGRVANAKIAAGTGERGRGTGELHVRATRNDTTARSTEVAEGEVKLQTEQGKAGDVNYNQDMGRINRDTKAATETQGAIQTETTARDAEGANGAAMQARAAAASAAADRSETATKRQSTAVTNLRNEKTLDDGVTPNVAFGARKALNKQARNEKMAQGHEANVELDREAADVDYRKTMDTIEDEKAAVEGRIKQQSAENRTELPEDAATDNEATYLNDASSAMRYLGMTEEYWDTLSDAGRARAMQQWQRNMSTDEIAQLRRARHLDIANSAQNAANAARNTANAATITARRNRQAAEARSENAEAQLASAEKQREETDATIKGLKLDTKTETAQQGRMDRAQRLEWSKTIVDNPNAYDPDVVSEARSIQATEEKRLIDNATYDLGEYRVLLYDEEGNVTGTRKLSNDEFDDIKAGRASESGVVGEGGVLNGRMIASSDKRTPLGQNIDFRDPATGKIRDEYAAAAIARIQNPSSGQAKSSNDIAYTTDDAYLRKAAAEDFGNKYVSFRGDVQDKVRSGNFTAGKFQLKGGDNEGKTILQVWESGDDATKDQIKTELEAADIKVSEMNDQELTSTMRAVNNLAFTIADEKWDSNTWARAGDSEKKEALAAAKIAAALGDDSRLKTLQNNAAAALTAPTSKAQMLGSEESQTVIRELLGDDVVNRALNKSTGSGGASDTARHPVGPPSAPGIDPNSPGITQSRGGIDLTPGVTDNRS